MKSFLNVENVFADLNSPTGGSNPFQNNIILSNLGEPLSLDFLQLGQII